MHVNTVNELDFLSEASAMRKISYAVSHCNDGTPADAPVGIPLPVGYVPKQNAMWISSCRICRLTHHYFQHSINI